MEDCAVIMYDIENMGSFENCNYKKKGQIQLFGEYEEKISKNTNLRIVSRKAFANFTQPGYAVLKEDINKYSIEPVQVFAFSKDRTKNAADMELCINSLNLCYNNPYIKEFYIVSNDGGFSSLAKHLRGNNKKVYGVGTKLASSTFINACDDFIYVNGYRSKRNKKKKNAIKNGPEYLIGKKRESLKRIESPLLDEFKKRFRRNSVKTTEEMFAESKRVLATLFKLETAKNKLLGEGVRGEIVIAILKYRIENFSVTKFELIEEHYPDFLKKAGEKYFDVEVDGNKNCYIKLKKELRKRIKS